MSATRLSRFVAALLLAAATQAYATNFVWNNPGGGNWSAPTNWSPNGTPGANDSVYISNAGIYTITLDTTNITIANLMLGGPVGQQTLATTNYPLTLASNISSLVGSNGVFLLQGGVFSGDLTVNGQLDWTGGQLGNTPNTVTITTNGVATLAGVNGTDYTLGEYVTNSGRFDLDSGNLNIDWCDFHGQFNNGPSGWLLVQTNVSIDGCASGLGLVNQGTVQARSGTEATFINAIFNNNGALDVQTGTVNIGGTGGGAGLFEAEAGATLVFSDNYEVDGILSGAGTNVLANGTLLLTGTNATSNTLLSGGTLMGVGGVLSGLTTWTSGAIGDAAGGITLASNGILALEGAANTDYSVGEYFTNAGTILLQSGNLQLNWVNYGLLVNLPGGLVNFASDGSIDDLGGSPGLFNFGTVRKSGGTNVSYINTTFINTGTLDVQSGVVDINPSDLNYSLTGGTIHIGISSSNAFGQVALSGNPAVLDGTISANLNNGYVPAAGNTFAVVTFSSSSGAFTNVNLPAAVAWQTTYGATNFVLTAQARTAPALTAPKWFARNQFEFSFSAATLTNYTIQYSTNLVNWTSILELLGTNGSGTLTIIDPNATNNARFYRIVSP